MNTTVAIQPQEISFAAPSLHTPAAQEPSQSFQQMLSSSATGGLSQTSGDSAAPVTQAVVEKGKDSEKAVQAETPACAAAIAVLFAMINPQTAEVSQSEGNSPAAAQAVSVNGIRELAGQANAVCMIQLPAAAMTSQDAVKERSTAPEQPMSQASELAVTQQIEISTEENQTQAVAVFAGEMTAEELMNGESEGIKPFDARENILAESDLMAGENALKAAAPIQTGKTGDVQSDKYIDNPVPESPEMVQAKEQPSTPNAPAVTETVFVQSGRIKSEYKQMQEDQMPAEVTSSQTENAKVAADDLIPVQQGDAVQKQKPKSLEQQTVTIQRTNAAVPQPLSEGKETGKSEQTEVPLVSAQIAQSAQKALKEGVTEFSIRLKPEGLGQVTVRVTGEKKNLVLEIRAESGATQKLISEQVGKLTADLCAGRYESVDVRIGGQTSNNSVNTGFSKDCGGQKYGGSRQSGESFTENKETPGRPLRFFAGGMLNCTA